MAVGIAKAPLSIWRKRSTKHLGFSFAVLSITARGLFFKSTEQTPPEAAAGEVDGIEAP